MNEERKNPAQLDRKSGAVIRNEKLSFHSHPHCNTKTLVSNYSWLTVPRDFSNLSIGATDVDGLIEYHGKAFIMFETKFGKGSMPDGQRLALERLCDTTTAAGKESILFVTTHNDERIIDMAATTVTKYRYQGEWKPAKFDHWTLDSAVSSFIRHVDRGAK